MATIKFRLVSKKDVSNIYLRILNGRKLDIQAKTNLFINKNNWHIKNNLPKQTTSENKNLTIKLLDLKSFILKEFNNANSDGTETNKEWLTHYIDLHFERITDNIKSDLLTDAIQSIIDEAPTRKNAKGGIGLSTSRINAYNSLKNIITDYQNIKAYKVKDVNISFAKDFLKYLLNTKDFKKSYALKKIADIKTVCSDADIYGIETNPQYKRIDSTQPKNENILYLTPKELKQIEDTNLINEAHANARKWLLLGCNIGQRGGDLLKLTETNFINRNGLEVIELKQQKTGKNVTIPVLETTNEIIQNGLPYPISIQKFNQHIKKVCEIAEINELAQGGIITVTERGKGNKQKRKIDGTYPKWQLMSSHVCRRSFATNLYGILPTPLIMQITAHSSEKMLLNYIGKDSLDYAKQIADFYTLQALKDKKETTLTVIKDASNQN